VGVTCYPVRFTRPTQYRDLLAVRLFSLGLVPVGSNSLNSRIPCQVARAATPAPAHLDTGTRRQGRSLSSQAGRGPFKAAQLGPIPREAFIL
jgi:hypothetical protein